MKIGMYPYQSCSGSVKDHYGRGYFSMACIEMLDSEHSRNLFSLIQNDKRFEGIIRKEKSRIFYGNDLPEGLRFIINFANPQGDKQKVLEDLVKEVVIQKQKNEENRKRVESICDIIKEFDVSDGSHIEFGFNNPNIIEGSQAENYAISVTNGNEIRDLGELKDRLKCRTDDFMLDNERSCTLYANDYITMLAMLKKTVIDFKTLGRGKSITIEDVKTKRKNLFLEEFNNATVDDSPSYNFEQSFFSINDLMGFLVEDGEQDEQTK